MFRKKSHRGLKCVRFGDSEKIQWLDFQSSTMVALWFDLSADASSLIKQIQQQATVARPMIYDPWI